MLAFMASPPTAGRPEARTEAVEDLVAMVLDGRVRIPVFQRGFVWDSGDVRELFDSIYRGVPIGALLLQQAPAEAEEVQIGPIPVLGTERQDALWVVDGQQRLTSLAVALGRPEPIPTTPVDRFVVYFDAATEQFRTPSEGGEVESTWVPLPRLLDASRLREWVSSWEHHDDTALRARVVEAGRRLREYRVPVYVIRTTDEELVRTIFMRINDSGKPLRWADLRDALFAPKGKAPSSLPELADELTKLGMGRPDEDELLPCLVAYRGLDVTRSFEEHLRSAPTSLDGVAAAALPTLRTAIGFLRSECKIPHLRLLPYSALLVVLTRFFKEHPEPNDRTQTLLIRWVWRTLLVSERVEGAFLLKGVEAITSDEEASVQSLLQLVPVLRVEIVLPETFDARSARSRLALLGLASLKPIDLESEHPIDVAGLVRQRDIDAFRLLFAPTGAATISPANRILLPGDGSAATTVRAFIQQRGLEHPALQSHAIDAVVAQALFDQTPHRALARRAELIANAVQSLGDRMAAWGHSDRPSLEYLMRQASG